MIRSHHNLSTWSLKAPILNSHLKVFPNVKDNKRIKITRLKTNYIYHKYKFTYIVYIYIFKYICILQKKKVHMKMELTLTQAIWVCFCLCVCLSSVFFFLVRSVKAKVWIAGEYMELKCWWLRWADGVNGTVSSVLHCKMRYFSQVLGYFFLNIICISRQSRHV